MAMPNAAIAGTMMTRRSLRSMGRSVNQRINCPPHLKTTCEIAVSATRYRLF
jgi:hypothetical protein